MDITVRAAYFRVGLMIRRRTGNHHYDASMFPLGTYPVSPMYPEGGKYILKPKARSTRPSRATWKDREHAEMRFTRSKGHLKSGPNCPSERGEALILFAYGLDL